MPPAKMPAKPALTKRQLAVEANREKVRKANLLEKDRKETSKPAKRPPPKTISKVKAAEIARAKKVEKVGRTGT
jgi:hypothetical protein